jgi:ketosteroid isomerase-like protein
MIPVIKRPTAALLCCLLAALAAHAKPSPAKSASPAAPDKTYLQKIWDGWATLDTKNVARFYAGGAHTFFDIAPLKYDSWQQYEQGVTGVLSGYKSARFTVNDDAAIHPHGDLTWATATIKEEMTAKSGKVEMGNFRWTVIFENQGGNWIIVHEHVSAPLQ